MAPGDALKHRGPPNCKARGKPLAKPEEIQFPNIEANYHFLPHILFEGPAIPRVLWAKRLDITGMQLTGSFRLFHGVPRFN